MKLSDSNQTYFERYIIPAFREFVADIGGAFVGFLVLCVAGFALSDYILHSPVDAEQAGSRVSAGFANSVMDGAQILSKAEESTLSTKLDRLKAETGHQLVVVTVASLDGKNIAQFATELGNSQGVGRKVFDDGVVVLVAPRERKVRIAVGKGLGSVLPDKLCAQIIQTSMLPHFRTGRISAGVNAGVNNLIMVLS